MSYKYKLYGAILGDLCGQPYEFPVMQHFPKIKDIDLLNPNSHITDDTIMTLATARSIMYNTNIEHEYKYMGLKYPEAGYGKGFKAWLKTPPGTTNDSYANGCLMRFSPFIYILLSCHLHGKGIESIRCSHAHADSYTACQQLLHLYEPMSKIKIGKYKKPKKFKKFDVSALGTVDFVAQVFMNTQTTEEAIKLAISCGGDTDTNASIVGELCNYKYKDITAKQARYVESKLDPYLLKILKDFNK